ncbi:MAG: TAXI family TRAP transporter solute-binding subunit [Pseudomonadota bacterium]
MRFAPLLAAAAATALALLAGTTPARATDLAIVTGSSSGTYIQFGRDMAGVAAPAGIRLDVRESAGSLTNSYAVRYTPGVQLGIVQSDVMGFLRARSEGLVGRTLAAEDLTDLRDLVDSLKLVLPLYIEEVHVLARREIRSLADLAGRRVSVGRNGGGTFITADQLFRVAGVEIERIQNLATNDAIELMRDGTIDAMVYVVGQPASAFVEQVSASDDFHFLPISEPRLLEIYDAAVIEPASYPWLDMPVQSIGVRSLLVSYDYEGEENCAAIGQLARVVSDNIQALRGSGHPKWRGVALDARVAAWERYRCVASAGGAAPIPGGSAPDGTGGSTGGASILKRFSR